MLFYHFQKKSQIDAKNYGGNFLNYSSNRNFLLITAAKKGVIYIYDTKKSVLKTTIEVIDFSFSFTALPITIHFCCIFEHTPK